MPNPPPVLTDELPLRFPTEELEGHAIQHLHHPAEIIGVLGSLIDVNALATLYINSNDHLTSIAILAILQGNLLVLEAPTGTICNEILCSPTIFCVAELNHIKVQFECRNPRLVEFVGRPALGVDMPKSLERIQRRACYRHAIKLSQPLSCFISLANCDEVEIPLIDISLGGIGLLGYSPDIRLNPGTIYKCVRIELPGLASFISDILIRSRFELLLRNGIRSLRTGAQFVNLSSQAQVLIQKYIASIEQSRFTA